ncbi:MAG: RHS repeat-associated core domain-containing protein [Chitinophagales bacterium]
MLVSTKDYIGGVEYQDGTIESTYHAEGRVFFFTNDAQVFTHRHEYAIKDHLGNIRLWVSDLDNDGILETPSEILQEKHFYPFGMEMEGPWMQGGANNPYQYNGKELVSDFGLNLMDYGARWYDAAVGRWWSVDLMAEKYSVTNPFAYVTNNPMKFIDPNGMELTISFKGFNKAEKEQAIKTVKSWLQRGLGDAYSVGISKKGKVTVSQNDNYKGEVSEGSSQLYGMLQEAQNNGDTKFTMSAETDEVNVDNDEAATMDYGDLQKIENMQNNTDEPNVITPQGKIAKMIYEQYGIQTQGKSHDEVHNEGVDLEDLVNGSKRGDESEFDMVTLPGPEYYIRAQWKINGKDIVINQEMRLTKDGKAHITQFRQFYDSNVKRKE